MVPLVGFSYLDGSSTDRDSLDSLLRDGSFKEQIEAAHQLAKLTVYDSLERSKYYASKGLDIATRNDDASGAAQNYQVLGLAHELEGYLDEAREFYRDGLSKVKDSDLRLAAELRMHIGMSYHIEGNRGRALEELIEALTIARNGGMQGLQSDVLNQIGNIYLEQQNYIEAIEIYENVIKILDLDDIKSIALAHQHLGTAYALSDKPKQSITSLEKALEHYQRLLLEDDQAEVQWRLAQTYYRLGDTVRAKRLNDEMLDQLPSILSNSAIKSITAVILL